LHRRSGVYLDELAFVERAIRPIRINKVAILTVLVVLTWNGGFFIAIKSIKLLLKMKIVD